LPRGSEQEVNKNTNSALASLALAAGKTCARATGKKGKREKVEW